MVLSFRGQGGTLSSVGVEDWGRGAGGGGADLGIPRKGELVGCGLGGTGAVWRRMGTRLWLGNWAGGWGGINPCGIELILLPKS